MVTAAGATPAASWPTRTYLATAMRLNRSSCWRSSPGKTMLTKSLYHQTLAMGVLLLSGCDVANNAQRDFGRLIHGNPFASSSVAQPAPVQARTSTAARSPSTVKPEAKSDAKPEEPKGEPAQTAAAAPLPTASGATTTGASLVGKSEGQVRAMLGQPTSVEERAPGKTWHYRDGRCSVDVQLYPDVQTRQFGTLAYEVKTDDNSDEGKRDCMARLRSR